MRALVAALALCLAAPLGAEALPAWRAVDEATGQIADVAGLEQLARDFPDSTSVRLRLFNAQLTAGDAKAALASLAWLKARGHVFGERARTQIPDLIGAAHAGAARALLIAAPEVIAASTLFGEIPAAAGLVETVFVPPGAEVVVAPSVSQRSVFFRGPSEQWVEMPLPDANALSGLVSAPDDSVGWVASANIDGLPEVPGRFTGLIGLDGDFGNPPRIAAPPGVAVSDLAAGPEGTIYASDPIGGGVYRAARGAEVLSPLVAPGTLRSPQGLAVSADGQRLYVSEYRYGLAIIALGTGAVTRLVSEVPVALDGIDGLWRQGDELIAVQNGTSPMRIIALRLSDDGSRITGHRVLEQANPEWTEPLGGSIADETLYYVGNGQWDRFDKGFSKPDLPPVPTQIRRFVLRP